MRQKINNCFHILYGCLFFLIISLLLLVHEAIQYPCKRTFPLHNVTVFLLIIVLGLLLFLITNAVKRISATPKFQNFRFKINYLKIMWVSAVVLFFLQVYISYNIVFTSKWDVYNVNLAAQQWAAGHSEKVTSFYNFSRYPNNLFITLCQAAILKLNNAFGIFQEVYANMAIVCVNCLFSTVTCVLVFKIVNLYQSQKYAFAGYILSIMLYGFSPWVTICYSDAFGILFPVLSFYLYAKPRKSLKTKIVFCALAASIACIGYLIKPQCIIILIAAVITEFLFNLGKANLKKLAMVFFVAVYTAAFYFLLNTALNSFYKKSSIVINKEDTFSMTHFAMMGLNEKNSGVYYDDDITISKNFKTAAERKNGNITVIKSRLHAMGPVRLTKHLAKKMLISYHDGTFAWGGEGTFYYQVPKPLNSKISPFLRSVYFNSGSRYLYFQSISTFVWMTVILLNFAAVFQKRNAQPNPKLCVLFLSIIGLTAFQLLFEVRARYLYTYLPIYCIIAVFGLKNFNCLCGKAVNTAKKLFKKRALQK